MPSVRRTAWIIAALLLAGGRPDQAGAADAAEQMALFQMKSCASSDYFRYLETIRQQIAADPYFPDFPYKAKVSFGSLRGAPKELIVNTKTGFNQIFPHYKLVQLSAHAGLNGGAVTLAHEALPNDPRAAQDKAILDFELYRRTNLAYLRDQYREWQLPAIASDTIELQEFFLPEHRKYEIMVAKEGRLLFFTRIKVGNHWRLWQGEPGWYQGDVPYVEVYQRDAMSGPFFYRKRIPTYFLPADLLLKDPYAASNPLNAIRATYPDHGIIEIGRTYVDHQAPKEDIEAASRIGFGMLLDILPDFAPERDLGRLVIVATGGPANARLYQRDYEMVPIADLTPLLGSAVLGPVHDVLGRTFSSGEEVKDAGLVPEFALPNVPPVRERRQGSGDPMGVTLLMTRGTEFAAKIRSTKQPATGLNLDHFRQNVMTLKDPNIKPIAPPGPGGWRYR